MPLLGIALMIATIYFLVQYGARAGADRNIPAHNDERHRHCPSCGTQADLEWMVCPYVGTPIDQ